MFLNENQRRGGKTPYLLGENLKLLLLARKERKSAPHARKEKRVRREGASL